MAQPITPAQLDAFNKDGYVILRGAFTKQRMQSLVDAINRLIDRALAGEVEIRWIDKSKRMPGWLENLLNPDRYDPAFGQWLDEDIIPHVEAFCGGPARHSLFGMIATGGGNIYKQKWHRDLALAGDPDEDAFLKRTHGSFVQFNAPLKQHDRYLQIVPGTHTRGSTPEELRVANAVEAGKVPGSTNLLTNTDTSNDDNLPQMPGAITVELDPGDVVYYNDNIWHRGWNPEGKVRWTMHSAFWSVNYPVMKHDFGQREQLTTPGHLDRLPPRTRTYVQRYLDAHTQEQPLAFTEY